MKKQKKRKSRMLRLKAKKKAAQATKHGNDNPSWALYLMGGTVIISATLMVCLHYFA
jgi:hypothetical protein